jgi:hypothetical protein
MQKKTKLSNMTKNRNSFIQIWIEMAASAGAKTFIEGAQ